MNVNTMMNCFNCKTPFQKKIGLKEVRPMVCVNCGKPQASRQSLKPQKPQRKAPKGR